jgi:hypothetical protein
MVPLQAGGSRLWPPRFRLTSRPLTAAVVVALVLAAILGQASLATAQQTQPANPSQTLDPRFFPATGYRVSSPAIYDYFLRRGGVRTFGYPVSNEFPLLGKEVQIFQRQMLQLDPDGTVSPATILDPDILPLTRIDGLNLPAADPEVIAAAPTTTSPDYVTQALAFVSTYAPDEWNGQAVNFQSTFLNTVSCADAFGTDPCDESLLPGFALEIWGLPTSLPTSDPLNSDFVYQRFQRGIMHFSRATGITQGLLVGDWLKRVIIGVDLSSDVSASLHGSRYFAQYAPTRPLALDRPADLPDTSLAQAFHADTLVAAGQTIGEPTLPPNVAQTATAVALTATAITGTQEALQGTQVLQTLTAVAVTATAQTATAQTIIPTAEVSETATPSGVISSIPVDGSGCLGDEQLWFTPRRPNVGVHVDISVTSQRHHDVRNMRLTGPMDPGPVNERLSPLGFVWTWTVIPTVEAFYEWTFYADGLHPCITSGFNAYTPLGASPTPTSSPNPTNTPGPTATPTSTVVPVPAITSITPSQTTCSGLVTIFGHGFGSPPSTFGTQVLFVGSEGTVPAAPNGGSDTSISATVPVGVTVGSHTVQVVTTGGVSNTVSLQITSCGGASDQTPTITPTSTITPTNTVVPVPVLASLTPPFGCNTPITAAGSNFGTTQGTVFLIGPSGTLTAPILSWNPTTIVWSVPSGIQVGTYSVIVSVPGAGATAAKPFLVSTSSNPTATPTPLPGSPVPTPITC